MANINVYTTNKSPIFLKKLSAVTNTDDNFFSSLSTSGLYKLASITPVIPPSTKVIYARN